MPTLTLPHSLPYGPLGIGGVRSGIGTRAYAWFQIINLSTRATSRREFGLINSGCTSTFLDVGVLSGTGLTLGPAVTVSVAGGGTVHANEVHGAAIEIEGRLAAGTVSLIFGTTSTPLIGRQAYLNAFDIAFISTAWLHA